MSTDDETTYQERLNVYLSWIKSDFLFVVKSTNVVKIIFNDVFDASFGDLTRPHHDGV